MDGDSTAPDASSVLTNTLPVMARSPSPVMARTLSSFAEAGAAGLQGHHVAGADGLQRQQVALCAMPARLPCMPPSVSSRRPGLAPPATCCDPHRGAAIFPSCEPDRRRLAPFFVLCCAGLDGARLLYFRCTRASLSLSGNAPPPHLVC